MAYKKAEYIQSNGTYFRTGIIHGTNPKVKMDFTVVSNYTSLNNYVFGVFSPLYYSNGSIALNVYGSSLKFRYYIGTRYDDNAANFTIGDRYECTLDKTALLINNKITSSSTTITITGSVPSATTQDYTIGALNAILDNKGIVTPSNIYIYEVTIYEDDIIAAHYLPYGDTETGYGLLYDTVSGNYLTANEPSKTTAFFPQFSIEPDSVILQYSGGTSALTITSEEGWTASTNDSWLTLSSTSGTGDSTINITAQLNKGQERTGIITVTNGNTNVSCTITQSKCPVLLYCENLFKNGNAINKIYKGNVVLRENLFIFNVDINEIEFEESGGTEQVAINSTKKWTATAPNWITLSSYSGRSGNITIAAESADTSRDGNIVIDNGVNQKIITVNQIIPSYELDLNNGEWIANGEVEGYTLYESTNNGKGGTTYSCYLKFTGQSATLMVQTDGEDGYDYVLVDDFDTGSSFWSGKNQTHNMYHTVVCNYGTNGVHTIAIKYAKDASVDNYTDKGYFYIKEIA